MPAHRNPTKVIGDILRYTERSGEYGIRPTYLMTKVSLSSSRLSEFIENLTSAGLITTKKINNNNAFVITSKGIEYLASYRRFISIAESYCLEL